MATETFLNGFGGNATIQGATFSVASWSLTITAQETEFTGSKVGQHPIVLTTFTRAVGSIVIDYSDADQPFQSSQGALIPGTTVTSVYFQLSPASNDGWTIAPMIIVATPQSLERAGKISTSIQLKSSGGLFTAPSGQVSW